jgi:hypothetical protein
MVWRHATIFMPRVATCVMDICGEAHRILISACINLSSRLHDPADDEFRDPISITPVCPL